jgi:hypothetical protein
MHPGDSISHGGAAHPGGKHRFAAVSGSFDNSRCRAAGVRHGLRSENHKHRIDSRIGEHGGQGVSVSLGRCVAQDVERVAVRPERWQRGAQFFDRRRVEFGEDAVAV